MPRIAAGLLVSAAVIFGSSSLALSQEVHRSGNTYHVQACPGPDRPGVARCHAHIVTDGNGNPLTRAASNVTPSGYGPTDLRNAYNVTGTGLSTTVIAIVDAYGYTNAESDLGVYRKTFNLPPCTAANGCFAKYNQNGIQGSYPRQNTGWAQETALDLAMASAMCPSCKIILVEANSANYADLAAAVTTAKNKGAHVISNSYGGGEAGSTAYQPAYQAPGVAITVSTGDSGYGVQFPASTPYVTAVGGTSLVRSSTSRGWSETAWSGAGSGCSQYYIAPSWQTTASVNAACGTYRVVADVSAIADPNTGVAVYAPIFGTFSAWVVFGGTSVGAPLIAGIYGVNGGSVNYGSDPYASYSPFPPYYGLSPTLNDVSSGSNGTCSATFLYLCTSGPGYDGPTGLGTPNGASAF
jgi:subtilase family serine protease